MLAQRSSTMAALWPTVRTASLGQATIIGLAAALPVAVAVEHGRDPWSAIVVSTVAAPAALALAVDDAAGPLTEAAPVPLWRRRALRVAILGAVVASSWSATLLIASRTERGVGQVGARLAEVLAAGATACAISATARRRHPQEPVGTVTALASVLALLTVNALAFRYRALPRTGDDTDRGLWLAVAIVLGVIAAWATRDPARRRHGASSGSRLVAPFPAREAAPRSSTHPSTRTKGGVRSRPWKEHGPPALLPSSHSEETRPPLPGADVRTGGEASTASRPRSGTTD